MILNFFKRSTCFTIVLLLCVSVSQAQSYSFNEEFNKGTVSEDNTELDTLYANANTVSDDIFVFTEYTPGVYLASDSIAFDQGAITLTGIALNESAEVSFTKQANPLPGKADTAYFTITAADGLTTKDCKVVIARSLYQCKIGFLYKGGDIAPTNWSIDGGNYASDSKGNGGAFPGASGMRIYNSASKGLGVLISPKYSSITSLSFAAKFSSTDDESLIIKKSLDEGETWIDVKTYTPAGGEIPSYSTETADDVLATQTLDINEENVMIGFYYQGTSTTPRLMIDDIACRANYASDANYTVDFTIYDINYEPLKGVTVTLGDEVLVTDDYGRASFTDVAMNYNLVFELLKDGITMRDSMAIISNTVIKRTFLDQTLDIFLGLGQSNMAGRAYMTSAVMEELENVSLLNYDDVWQAAKNPMNLYSNVRKDESLQEVGPSYSFSKTLSKYVDHRIAMVVNARGGTKISEFNTTYHDPIMNRIAAAKVYGEIKGVIWHQGEGDRSSADTYLDALNLFVQDLRAEAGNEVYFVAGQCGPWDEEGTTTPKYGPINDTIAHIANYITNSGYVSSSNLTDRGDNTHFNLESQIILGQRYAQNVLAKIYNIDIAIIDIAIEGDGFVIYESDTLTTENDFSVTSLKAQNVSFSIHADQGKEFTQLYVNGIEIMDAVGDSLYNYSINTNSDTTLSVVMATKETDLSTVSLNASKQVYFYPNPATGTINIVSSSTDFSVSIFDLTGRMVQFQENQNVIHIENLLSGTYLIKIEANHEQVINKLIVQ
jgi:hypothetical protein